MQQQNEVVKQLNLFTTTSDTPSSELNGIETSRTSVVELLSRLEQQRTLTQNILERVVDYGNLNKAYKQVKSNDGSAGWDGMNIEELQIYLSKHIEEMQQSILNGSYKVSPVRRIEIDKPNGGKRKLGIPTVRDRLIHQAISQQMNIYYDTHFSEHSFGFRPNRSAHDAIKQASLYVREGKEWVVDIDLEKFFDTINHDRLMQRLSKGIGDKRLLRLINAFLKAGIMNDGIEEQHVSGTPQGSPLSPLLSNIVLDELDKELEKRGLSFCRYADDCNIFVKSKRAGIRVLETITKFIETKLKLKVNKEKSGVRHCSNVTFLGYTIMSLGKIRVSDSSLTRLKDKLKEITKRNKGERFDKIISKLNAIIIGWTNYFRMANFYLTDFRDIDSWLRRKLRCYRLKQCGRKYSIFKFLRSFGFTDSQCWNVIMYSQGWWKMSKKKFVNKAMSLSWFVEQGLQSFYFRMNRAS